MGKIGPKDQHGSDSDGEGENAWLIAAKMTLPQPILQGHQCSVPDKTDPRFGSLKEEGMDGKDDHEA